MDSTKFKKRNYVHFQAPFEKMHNSGNYLASPELCIKQDNVLCLADDVKKTRKLEFLLEDARIQTLVVVLSSQTTIA